MSRGPLLVVLALASLVASCAEQTTASRGAKGGDGTLRLSLLGEPHTLNPNLGPGELSFVAGQNIFNRLVSLAPDGSILPELAHSWEMSESPSEFGQMADTINLQRFSGGVMAHGACSAGGGAFPSR